MSKEEKRARFHERYWNLWRYRIGDDVQDDCAHHEEVKQEPAEIRHIKFRPRSEISASSTGRSLFEWAVWQKGSPMESGTLWVFWLYWTKGMIPCSVVIEAYQADKAGVWNLSRSRAAVVQFAIDESTASKVFNLRVLPESAFRARSGGRVSSGPLKPFFRIGCGFSPASRPSRPLSQEPRSRPRGKRAGRRW